jgi:glycosyltransferase involved in cell wall biosynthesis
VPWEQLGLLGHDRALDGLVTVAMLHNVRTLSWKVSPEDLPTVVSGLARMTRLLVHTREDLNLLLELGLDRNVGLFPHGAVAPGQSRWPRRLRAGDAPVIGCHGFFLRHKGIDKLIRAAAILRREWPDLKLRLVNARFPNPEHEGAVGECMELARELGIEDAIEWHLDFLPVDRIEALLAGCDLIVLPYDDSDDSVSGAVRTALASMVPLVATRVKIFGDLGAAVGWADSNDPDVLADTIAPILRSPEKRREIQAGMHAWLTAHDWQRMATTLENMIHGLVRQKRLGWLLPSDGKA